MYRTVELRFWKYDLRDITQTTQATLVSYLGNQLLNTMYNKIHFLMADLHIIGEITKALNFKETTLICKYNFHTGKYNDFLEDANSYNTILFQETVGNFLQVHTKGKLKKVPTVTRTNQSGRILLIYIILQRLYKILLNFFYKFTKEILMAEYSLYRTGFALYHYLQVVMP